MISETLPATTRREPNPRSKTEPVDTKDQPTVGRATRPTVEPVRRWTIALRYAQGEKVDYIAAKERVSKAMVVKVAQEHALPLRGRGPHPKTAASAEAMAVLNHVLLDHLRAQAQRSGTPGDTARAMRIRHHFRNAALWLSMAIKNED